MLTQAELKTQLHYNPETGIFTWIKSKSRKIKPGNIAGSLTPYNYIIMGINKKLVMAHKLAWLYIHGYIPKYIDHINGDSKDNRLCNLREVTSAQNNQNAKIRKDNTTGVKGVSFRKSTQRYRAIIKYNKNIKYLGDFKTLDEAKEAIEKARNFYHGEFARHQ